MSRRMKWSSVVLALSFGVVSPAIGAEPGTAVDPQAASTKEAAAATKPADAPAAKLDVEVVALLQRTAKALESRSIETEEEAGFRALITAGDLLREDKTLAPSERDRLRALCRVRLAQAEDVLRRQTAKQAATEKTGDGKRKVVAHNAVMTNLKTVAAPANPILAQQIPGGLGFGRQQGNVGAGQTNAAKASAEELIEIIESSIKPESWETNGGTGVIRYFSIGHGLVIRATADVHGNLGGVLGQLRP